MDLSILHPALQNNVNLGMMHHTHHREEVNVNHIFACISETKNNACHKMGYLDTLGTRVVDCCRGDLELEG
jgi:hypothetical protein